jgi:hypothetical protein
MVPALAIDGIPHSILHPMQAGRLLGIAVDPRLEPARLAWDVVSVLESWLELLRLAPWPLVLEPTPSRERSTRELFVNVCCFLGLLADGWTTGTWNGPHERGLDVYLEHERSTEESLADKAKLLDYGTGVHLDLTTLFQEIEDELATAPARLVHTAGGELSFAHMLDAQRVHAAQHYRQAATFLESVGAPVPRHGLDAIRDLQLPNQVY